MIPEELNNIVEKAKEKKVRGGYIINLIKEHLQNIVLEYIYGNKEINNTLVFTGGTCLRFCFGLPRLSEDLDFDTEKKPDYHSIAQGVKNHFKETLRYREIDFSIKGKEQKIYLKFPILKQLDLSFNESFLLLLKIEIARKPMNDCKLETSMVEKNGRTYFLKRYSLPDLMAGKIHAFLTRLFFKGKENEVDFKGRDMYDLVWYMGKGIRPNTQKMSREFSGTKYERMEWGEMLREIQARAGKIKKSHIHSDLINFIEEKESIDNFLNNYLNIINQYCEKYA